MWYDRGLLSGQEWEFQIASQVSLCGCVILFATKKLFKRDKGSYVRTEYDMAIKSYNKKVIIALLDDIRESDVKNTTSDGGMRSGACIASREPTRKKSTAKRFVSIASQPIRDMRTPKKPSSGLAYHNYVSHTPAKRECPLYEKTVRSDMHCRYGGHFHIFIEE